MPKSNPNLDGLSPIQPKTLCHFGCTEAATCITLIKNPNGDLQLIDEVNGIIQDQLTLTYTSEGMNDAINDFGIRCGVVLKEVFK